VNSYTVRYLLYIVVMELVMGVVGFSLIISQSRQAHVRPGHARTLEAISRSALRFRHHARSTMWPLAISLDQ
jgi:hypothetical protein